MRNEINSREKKFGISLFVIPLLSVYKVRNHDFLYVFFLGIPLLRLRRILNLRLQMIWRFLRPYLTRKRRSGFTDGILREFTGSC